MSGGSLFNEDIWKIACEGLRAAMRATLVPVKRLIPCYQAGSSNVSGDDGYRVRVLTRRDASWEQTIRHGQLAEQVDKTCSIQIFLCSRALDLHKVLKPIKIFLGSFLARVSLTTRMIEHDLQNNTLSYLSLHCVNFLCYFATITMREY